jgi:ABC-type branched-subunit amino acid transport system substrate-binding protein
MLAQNPDMVLAFPGGPGTAHMVEIARTAGIRVEQVDGAKPP